IEPRFAGARAEMAFEEFRGDFHDARERCLALGPVAGFRAFLRHGEPGLAGELLDRIAEIEPVTVHDKADHVTMRAAAEAVIEALILADGEGGRLLVMKRAKTAGLVAAANQADLAPHHITDGNALP